MHRRTSRPAVLLLAVALIALVGLVSIPALAASPSPGTETPAETAKPGKGPKADKVPKADRVKIPEVSVTVSGTVGTRTTATGETEYTLTDGSKVVVLDAGPPWFWKDGHPLAAHVGQRVTVTGEQRQGSAEVDVQTVDGTAIREPGKPPWAGGWKRVGKDHPGWTQEKADRWAAKIAGKKARFGLDCWPPGHCKDATGKPATPGAAPTPTPAP